MDAMQVQGTSRRRKLAGDGDPGFALDEAKSFLRSFSFWLREA
jgi:hypothetical protein